MVRNGYAFDWPRYSKGKFAKKSRTCKGNKLGIWNMKFEYPWIWRKKVKKKNEKIIIYLLFFLITACSSIPQNTADGCSIFSERYLWYKHVKKQKKNGEPQFIFN